MVATREATRETEKNMKETNGGAREHNGNRELSKPASTTPATYRAWDDVTVGLRAVASDARRI